MKNLNEFLNNTYVSLDNIDESCKDKISNLDGKVINECCGCGCNDKVCSYDDCCTRSCFCNQEDVIRILKNTPKVSDMYQIHSELGVKYRYPGFMPTDNLEPLFFRDYSICGGNYALSGEPQQSTLSVNAIQNEKLYKFLTSIFFKYTLHYPCVVESEGKVQVFATSIENHYDEEHKNIKSSLESVSKILTKLENEDTINWAQVLDISIDNINNTYIFLITFTLDTTQYIMTQADYDKLHKEYKKESKKIDDGEK